MNGSTVPPIWVLLGRHFANCDTNGELWLVNGAFGAVTDLCSISLIFVSSQTYEGAIDRHVKIDTGRKNSATKDIVANLIFAAYLCYWSEYLQQIGV